MEIISKRGMVMGKYMRKCFPIHLSLLFPLSNQFLLGIQGNHTQCTKGRPDSDTPPALCLDTSYAFPSPHHQVK